ncbi:phasin family protein [Azospirillum sp. YIM B02556]|uniref:Phasin family protein n=1 Tax=Azospirillum endophyticum TaxID=2800326 RepID=A0ABS1FAQ7_9PROT|nr:phasin family protein [Azospirillum endophyticum]MBK1840510.1 phasin family protein [Azospirillum endophyticum]
MRNQAASTYASPRLANELSAWTSGNLVQNTFLQRTEAILRMQSNLFDGFESLSHSWLEHRQDDIRSALSAVERMGAIENAAERSSLWNEWLADRMKRWSEEASAMVEQAQSVSRTIADQTSATVQRSLQAKERHADGAGVRRDRKSEETNS